MEGEPSGYPHPKGNQRRAPSTHPQRPPPGQRVAGTQTEMEKPVEGDQQEDDRRVGGVLLQREGEGRLEQEVQEQCGHEPARPDGHASGVVHLVRACPAGPPEPVPDKTEWLGQQGGDRSPAEYA